MAMWTDAKTNFVQLVKAGPPAELKMVARMVMLTTAENNEVVEAVASVTEKVCCCAVRVPWLILVFRSHA